MSGGLTLLFGMVVIIHSIILLLESFYPTFWPAESDQYYPFPFDRKSLMHSHALCNMLYT